MTAVSKTQRDTLKALYKDLGWNTARQEGMQQRQLGHIDIRSGKDAQTMIVTLQSMLLGWFKPHVTALYSLLNMVATEHLTDWERSFLDDVRRKTQTRQTLSVKVIKKVRQIAHVHDIECGFPSFRDLAKQADARRSYRVYSINEGESHGLSS